MSQPEAVNGTIIDAVTAANSKVLAEAPAMAMGSLYQTIGHSVAMAAASTVYAQQTIITYQTNSILEIMRLLSIDE